MSLGLSGRVLQLWRVALHGGLRQLWRGRNAPSTKREPSGTVSFGRSYRVGSSVYGSYLHSITREGGTHGGSYQAHTCTVYEGGVWVVHGKSTQRHRQIRPRRLELVRLIPAQRYTEQGTYGGEGGARS
jgi:hypothetical protein